MVLLLNTDGNPIEPYWLETYESRKISRQADGGTTAKIFGKVVGTEDDAVAEALIWQELPTTWPTPSIALSLHDYDMEHLGGGVWAVVATYVGKLPAYTFDTTGGTKHITQSRETVADYTVPFATSPPPDFKGAIGVTEDSIEGCDITVPVYKFTETHNFSLALITTTYLRNVFNLTGRTNNAPFRWFAEGEVLFLGARGSQHGNEQMQITFEFAASPNIDSADPDSVPLQIGDIEVTDKGGWEYLWTRYLNYTSSRTKVKQPVSVHVERVYESGNFDQLFPDALVPQIPVEPAP